eukprot:SAG25_NODE_559_length_6924_cov_15.045421_2_plen_331_part_00
MCPPLSLCVPPPLCLSVSLSAPAPPGSAFERLPDQAGTQAGWAAQQQQQQPLRSAAARGGGESGGGGLPPAPPSGQQPSALSSFLEKLGIPQFLPHFVHHELDLDALVLCSDDDFKDIGIPKGPRVKLRNAVKSGAHLTQGPPRGGQQQQQQQLPAGTEGGDGDGDTDVAIMPGGGQPSSGYPQAPAQPPPPQQIRWRDVVHEQRPTQQQHQPVAAEQPGGGQQQQQQQQQQRQQAHNPARDPQQQQRRRHQPSAPQQRWQAPPEPALAVAPAPAATDVRFDIVKSLQAMGFPEAQCAQAALATQNEGVGPALDWLLAYSSSGGDISMSS